MTTYRASSATTKPPRVLLLENIHRAATEALSSAGYQVETVDSALNEEELFDRLTGVQLLGIRSTTQVTKHVLEQAPDLLAVGAFCIGVNQVDVEFAAERGIAVFNAPFSNTRSVVELAIAEIIALTRRLTDKSAARHAGGWDKSAVGSHEVRGRKLGIVGYGNIGSQLSVIAEALGMSVYFYDTTDKLALGNARRCSSLAELLETADVVTLHVDGRSGNSGMFGDQEFRRMRDGAIFLNLSRGFVVDHDALRAHLASGHLAGAAVDVFPHEPKRRGEPFESQLRGLANTILTPHVGGSTEEAQHDIGRFVASKLRHFADGGDTSLSVNLPQLTLPERAGTHRIALMHRNNPGVLAAINSVFGTHDINIEGQVLSTRGGVGYALTDVSAEPDQAALDRLSAMPETIQLRILS